MFITSKQNAQVVKQLEHGVVRYELLSEKARAGGVELYDLVLYEIPVNGFTQGTCRAAEMTSLFVLQGSASVAAGGITCQLTCGQLCALEPGQKFEIKNAGETALEVLEISGRAGEVPEGSDEFQDIEDEMDDELGEFPSSPRPNLDDWPEMKSVLDAKEERLQKLEREINAEIFHKKIAQKVEGIFILQELNRQVPDGEAKVRALYEQWREPMKDLVSRLAQIYTYRPWSCPVRIIQVEGGRSFAILWFLDMYQWPRPYYIPIKLVLDRDLAPKEFRIETEPAENFLVGEPSLAALKVLLANGGERLRAVHTKDDEWVGANLDHFGTRTTGNMTFS